MTFDPVINDSAELDKDFPASLRSILLKSEGSKLLCTMFLANGPGPHPTVLLTHGFPGNENNFDVAHAIRRNGWNVFTFHYRGMWGSEGDFSWNNCVDDVKVAVDYLRSGEASKELRVDANRLALIGYSMGGFTAMMHTAEDEGIKNVASIAGYNFGLIGEMIPTVPNGKEMALEGMELGVSFVKGTTTHKLYDELLASAKKFNLLNYAEIYAKKNILLIGATHDTTAPMNMHYDPMVKTLSGINAPNLTTKVIDSGHGFSTKRIELSRTVIGWLDSIEF